MPINRIVLLPLLVSLGTCLSPAQTPVTFLQPENIGPCAFAVGADFNGDGNLDVACPTPEDVTIWLGDGHGHFRQTSQTLPYPAAVLAEGDFTGDGIQDLVVASAGEVYLLPGNGDGTFGAQIPLAAVEADVALTAADINQDGNLDLLIGSGKIWLLLGNGNGAFQKPQVLPLTYGKVNIAVADFNGDGIPDIATSANINDTGFIEVLLGKGDGTFGSPIDTAMGTPWSYFVVADFNGDGKLDVAWGYGYQTGFANYVLLGNGDGTFSPGPVTPCSAAGDGGLVLAADLNGDGLPDLVIAGSMGIALNVGGGKFGPIDFYQNSRYFSAIAGDFRHLGRVDLMVSGEFYPNEGDGRFDAPRSYSGCSGCAFLLAGDFNNDGNLDVVGTIASSHDNIVVYPGGGNGDFNGTVKSTFNLPKKNDLRAAAIADFNGDGNLDLALSYGRYSTDGETDILFGNGNGAFANQTAVLTGHTAYSIAVADFNRNGHVGLALGLEDQVQVLAGNGAGGFQTTATLEGIGNTEAVITADFNGDGIPDLATASDVYLGNGDGTFRHTYMFPQAATTLQTGDFNGDGIPDLATSDGDSIVVWPGIGDGTFGVPTTVTADQFQAPFVVADWNGDGISDIAVTPGLATVATFYLGKTDGTFATSSVANLPLFSQGPAFGQGGPIAGGFTNNGKNDLLYVDGRATLLVLINTTK